MGFLPSEGHVLKDVPPFRLWRGNKPLQGGVIQRIKPLIIGIASVRRPTL